MACSRPTRSALCLSALLETVRDRTKTVDLEQVNRVLLQPHWRKKGRPVPVAMRRLRPFRSRIAMAARFFPGNSTASVLELHATSIRPATALGELRPFWSRIAMAARTSPEISTRSVLELRTTSFGRQHVTLGGLPGGPTWADGHPPLRRQARARGAAWALPVAACDISTGSDEAGVCLLAPSSIRLGFRDFQRACKEQARQAAPAIPLQTIAELGERTSTWMFPGHSDRDAEAFSFASQGTQQEPKLRQAHSGVVRPAIGARSPKQFQPALLGNIRRQSVRTKNLSAEVLISNFAPRHQFAKPPP